MPASAMTTSLPRPRSVSGIPRDRAKRTSARSSWALWTVANRSAGPPTRIVVNRASGSSRDVLTPIRRWMSVPIAIASKAEPDPCSVAAAAVTRAIPATIALDPSAVGQRLAGRRAARTSAATASAAPGRPSARAAAAIAARAASPSDSSRSAAATSASASNASSATSRAAPASARTRAFARLVAGGVRVRDDRPTACRAR